MEPETKTPIEADSQDLRRKVQEYERWFRFLDGQNRVLERERQKLSAVLNNTDAGFVVLDGERSVVWANEIFRKSFGIGLHPGTVVGSGCHRVLCGKESFCEECPALGTLSSSSVAHHEMQLEIGGRAREVYVTAMPIKSPFGDTEETILMLQDVSDLQVLRRSQEALRESQTRLSMIIDQMPAVLWSTDRELRFTSSSGKGLAAIGGEPNKVVGQSLYEYFGTDDPDFLPIAMHRRAVEGESVSYSFRWAGRVFETNVRPFRDADEKIVGSIGSALDVTEKEQTQAALRRSEEQVRHAQKMRAIGTLAGGVAHDFNNLLTGILGEAELLMRTDTTGADGRRAAERIQSAARRAAELTQQLLGFARGGKHRNLAVDVSAILDEVAARFERIPAARGAGAQGAPAEAAQMSAEGVPATGETAVIRVERRTPSRGPYALGDPSQILEVVLNLAWNARDAMPSGGRLFLGAEEELVEEPAGCAARDGVAPGRYVVLTVADTGRGMTPEVRGRIFEPFFTTKDRDKGKGMGLAMVDGIVANHGGSIAVESEPGRGSLFRIHLPAAEPPAEGRKPSESALAAAPVPIGTRRVLVVDDEECVREVAKGYLRHLGYDVVVVRDGQEGADYYARHAGEIDVVLIDMIMPRLGGRECFLALKKIDPGVKAILCSGYGMNEAAQSIVDEGMCGFVQKPYEIDSLEAMIRRALGA